MEVDLQTRYSEFVGSSAKSGANLAADHQFSNLGISQSCNFRRGDIVSSCALTRMYLGTSKLAKSGRGDESLQDEALAMLLNIYCPAGSTGRWILYSEMLWPSMAAQWSR